MNRIVLIAGAIGGLSIAFFTNVSQAKELPQLQLCKKFLGLGVVVQTLENICKIKGPVSRQVLAVYEQGDCKHVVPQNDVDEVISDTADKLKQHRSASRWDRQFLRSRTRLVSREVRSETLV